MIEHVKIADASCDPNRKIATRWGAIYLARVDPDGGAVICAEPIVLRQLCAFFGFRAPGYALEKKRIYLTPRKIRMLREGRAA
jgi:hypothetical protein